MTPTTGALAAANPSTTAVPSPSLPARCTTVMRYSSREVVGERAGAVRRVVVDDDELAVDSRGPHSRERSRGPDPPADRARCRWARRCERAAGCAGATAKDETRKHYNPVAPRADAKPPPPGARRRPAAGAPAVARAADGRRPGAVRVRRRADSRRRSAVSRRLGSEAAGDSLRVRPDARRRGTRRGRRRRRSPRRRSGRVAALPLGHGASDRQPAAATAALLFLLLSNPAFTRLGGIRLRAQCETFIAVAVAGAFLLLARSPQPRERDGPLSEPALCSGSRSSSSTTPGSTSPQAWRLHGCGGD